MPLPSWTGRRRWLTWPLLAATLLVHACSDSDGASAVETTTGCDATDAVMRARMLTLINESRAANQACGDEAFPAVPPLSWDERLHAAAHRHSNDMARHDFFSHTGSDGLSVGQRVSAVDYAWRSVGENIAAGHDSARAAIDGWMISPGHCRNIMSSRFTAVAVACVQAHDTGFKHYWTQVLASPRR